MDIYIILFLSMCLCMCCCCCCGCISAFCASADLNDHTLGNSIRIDVMSVCNSL